MTRDALVLVRATAVDFACCFLERRAHRLKPTGQADKLYGFHVSPPPTRHSATSYALAPHLLQRKCAKEGEKYGEVRLHAFSQTEWCFDLPTEIHT